MTAPLILCIEDEPALRDDIAFDLRDAGYEVLTAADADQALTLLEGQRPDLILCDIVMPGMDGKALLAHLRQRRPDLDAVPFLFLTALTSRAQVIDGRIAGADDYVAKPIDYDLLRATVAARLRQVTRLRDAQPDGAGLAALDLLSLGVVLLAVDGSVIHANISARKLAPLAGIALSGRVTGQGEDGRRLSALIDRLLTPGGDAEEALRLHSGAAAGAAVMVAGLRLRREGPGGRARAMLVLSDPDRVAPMGDAMLGQLFGLTPTEARVASLLAEGLRRDQIAAQIGISQTTVAFHLRNIFGKTGAGRQAELVGLILSMPLVTGEV
ncbi:response regulator [Paracoccus jeotgali]|uniref:response regulator n=1 Tax=Paracoccus jeotgali TaxID=2065379 RepID=UPI0028ADABCA|nr:response regulator [Paracoccus jeotgali]